MKKIVVVFLMLVLLALIGLGFMYFTSGNEKAPKENDNVSVGDMKTITYINDRDGKIACYYPEVGNTKIDREIKKFIDASRNNFKTNYKKPSFSQMFQKNELFITYHGYEYKGDTNVISVKFNRHEKHPGKDPVNDVKSLNFNMDEIKEVTVADIFYGDDYISALNKESGKTKITKDNLDAFALDGENLHIFINSDKVNEEPGELTLPIENMKNHLSGKYGGNPGNYSDEELKDMKLIAMTFDDGPDPTSTPRLLKILDKEQVKATFFVLGSMVNANPDVLKQTYDEGHQIASHTYDHKQLTVISDSERKSEINKTNDLIKEVTGENPSTMRPPYGAYNDKVRADVKTPVIMWSIDPLDWKNRNAKTVTNSVMQNAHDGAILLLHDIHPTSIDAVKSIVPKLKAEGYTFVTVDQLIRVRDKREDGKVYTSLPAN